MSKFSNSIFPPNASNNYQGHKIALWGLTLLTVMTIARSLVHLFKSDGGAQSIATIPLDSYTAGAATAIIRLFAFWGFSQLLLGLFYVVVLTRYRNLIPLKHINRMERSIGYRLLQTRRNYRASARQLSRVHNPTRCPYSPLFIST